MILASAQAVPRLAYFSTPERWQQLLSLATRAKPPNKRDPSANP